MIQLEFIRIQSGEEFESMIDRKAIVRKRESISREEYGQVINCLKTIRDDIPIEIQELIF